MFYCLNNKIIVMMMMTVMMMMMEKILRNYPLQRIFSFSGKQNSAQGTV